MSKTVEIDDTRLRVRFAAMPGAVHAALVAKVAELRLKLEAAVKEKLSGSVLHVRTGRLRRSIFSEQSETATSVEGVVAQSADVPYGRIHEYGGTTRPHLIVPVKANVLAFVAGGKAVFARRVNHPGSVIPMRAYMRPSLAEMRGEIVEGLTAAAVEAMRE